MIRPIMRNELFLGMPSEPAALQDVATGQDLLETLCAHEEECVGMAANMIGVRKRIIAFKDGSSYSVMYNPEIVHASGKYPAEEGCLSLSGLRPCERYRKIRVSYLDEAFERHEKSYEGFTAQIIQHELDHCDGIVI